MTCYRPKLTAWLGKRPFFRHFLTLGGAEGQTVDTRSPCWHQGCSQKHKFKLIIYIFVWSPFCKKSKYCSSPCLKKRFCGQIKCNNKNIVCPSYLKSSDCLLTDLEGLEICLCESSCIVTFVTSNRYIIWCSSDTTRTQHIISSLQKFILHQMSISTCFQGLFNASRFSFIMDELYKLITKLAVAASL